MFAFVLSCINLCPFQFCSHLAEEQKACCFASIILQMHCYFKWSVALPPGAVGGLQYVTVVFPDHTHLLFVGFLMSRLNCFGQPEIMIQQDLTRYAPAAILKTICQLFGLGLHRNPYLVYM